LYEAPVHAQVFTPVPALLALHAKQPGSLDDRELLVLFPEYPDLQVHPLDPIKPLVSAVSPHATQLARSPTG